jgi:hypothetical protein
MNNGTNDEISRFRIGEVFHYNANSDVSKPFVSCENKTDTASWTPNIYTYESNRAFWGVHNASVVFVEYSGFLIQ